MFELFVVEGVLLLPVKSIKKTYGVVSHVFPLWQRIWRVRCTGLKSIEVRIKKPRDMFQNVLDWRYANDTEVIHVPEPIAASTWLSAMLIWIAGSSSLRNCARALMADRYRLWAEACCL